MADDHRYTLRIRDETEDRLLCDAEFEATKQAVVNLIYSLARDFGDMDPRDASILPDGAK